MVELLVVLLVLGVILWGVGQFPIDATIAKLIRVVIVVIALIYIIYFVAAVIPSGFPLPGRLR